MNDTENGGPMLHDPRMTGRDSTDDLIEQYATLLRAYDVEERVSLLTDFVFAYVGAIAKRFAEIRRKLPVKPWIFNVASGVGLATILAATIAGTTWLTRIDILQFASGQDRQALHAECEENKRTSGKLETRLARIDGNLEVLMRSRGLQPLPPVPDTER